LVAALARTPPGRRALRQLTPSFDEPGVRRLMEETAELAAFRIPHGRLPLAGVDEIVAALEALESSGGAADPRDLKPILAVARAAEAVRRALAKADSPHLSRRREELPQFTELIERARRLFDADGSVRDDASPQLGRLRARMRRRRTEVSRSLGKLLEERREFLGDAVVVLRNDRYCLPVIASARARMPGIVHDRSGSGQTIFVEPLEVIEGNNELALLAAEERREVERLLSEFGREVLARAPDLEASVEALGQLDAFEAKVEFGEITRGRLPELSQDRGWTLVAARHPLLDPLLASLRRRVLSETRPEREIIPLDLELLDDRRLLVVSGPNAGGKTVVLKTAGLFSMLAQCGIPIPAATGTRLPVFRGIRAEIGDAQEILSDRSTFSSSMETLSEILGAGGPDALALIDEIGSATDPEEGSALAVAWLEEYLSRGGRAIVTTHLSAIKNFAASRADAVCAAMEFDETTGRPNYRLHPGLSGRSRALAVAQERGMPGVVLSRAREILGDSWTRQQARESEAEAALERLRGAERELAGERERARREAEKLAQERDVLVRERARLLEQGLERFERARRELARRLEEEVAAIRQDSARRAETSAGKLAADVSDAVEHEEGIDAMREELSARAAEPEVGGRARLRGGRIEGTVVSLEGETGWLEVAGKRMRIARADLEPVTSSGIGKRESRTEQGRQGMTVSRLPISDSRDGAAGVTLEVNVIGRRLDEAIAEVEKKLDEAIVAGAGRLRIVHGHGTGRLRTGLREHFRNYPGVARLFPADAREGGNGATIVELV
jgi:DNA mismatch repair protein MutS2